MIPSSTCFKENCSSVPYAICSEDCDHYLSSETLPFDEFITTKYLTPTQQDYVRNLPIKLSELNRFLEKISSFEGIAEITLDRDNYEKYPLIAIHALLRGKITQEQFATICMLYQGIYQMCVAPARFELQYNYETKTECHYRLNLEPAIYSSCQDNLSVSRIQIHSINGDEQSLHYLKEFFHITKEGVHKIISNLQNAPEIEKVFFTFTLPFGPIGSWSPLYHRINDITNFLGPVNAFSSYTGGFPPYQPQLLVLPSATLFQNFLSTAFSESAVICQPIVGRISPFMITKYKQRNIRLINVAIPGIDMPDSDGQYFGGKLIFTFHDYYHALRDTVRSPGYQSALRRIDHLLKNIILQNPSNIAEIKKLKWKLNDGEFFGILGQDNTSLTMSNFGIIFKNFAWPQEVLESVIHDMVKEKDLWSKYRVTRESLNPKEQALYDSLQKP
ncbi:MAG: hypothetical protein Q8L98_00815 [Chlamydiales bacterium]|nr:hypothetical protein [Chlamydiales bacterium]